MLRDINAGSVRVPCGVYLLVQPVRVQQVEKEEDMSHKHDWSDWTRWIFYAGGNQDFREKHCKECPETEEQTRAHQHNYSPVPDPHAPVGSGGTVQVCDSCGKPKK